MFHADNDRNRITINQADIPRCCPLKKEPLRWEIQTLLSIHEKLVCFYMDKRVEALGIWGGIRLDEHINGAQGHFPAYMCRNSVTHSHMEP